MSSWLENAEKKINKFVIQTTNPRTSALPISDGRLATAANVQAAVQAEDPEDREFLALPMPAAMMEIDDIYFPEWTLYEKTCSSGHPLLKVSISQYYNVTKKRNFNCLLCQEQIGMDRSTVNGRGLTFMKACFNCPWPHNTICGMCSGVNNRPDTIDNVANAHKVQLQGQLMLEAGHKSEKVGMSMIGHAKQLHTIQDASTSTSTPTNPEGCLVERPSALRDAAGDDWIIVGDSRLDIVKA